MVMTDRGQRFVCAATFVLSTAILVGAAPRKPAGPPMLRQAVSPAALKNETFTSKSGDFRFSRERRGKDWEVTYRFQGLEKEHEISCRINIQESQRLIDDFSYKYADKASEIASTMAEEAKKLKGSLMSLGEPSFSAVYVEKEDKIKVSYDWKWKQEKFATAIDWEYAQDDAKAFFEWYKDHKADLITRAERKFLVPRGFIFERRQGWMIDYARLVERGTPVLRNCIEAFGKEAGKDPEILMTFFQAMPYALIEDRNTGWATGGVRVPTSVLLQREGDCDSKAVAFCVLHRDHAPGLVIFRSFRQNGDKRSGHALVGVESFSSRARWPEGKAWPIHPLEAIFYKEPILVADRYFVPCEVAGGEGRLPYGQVALRLDGKRDIYQDEYLAIPIAPPEKVR